MVALTAAGEVRSRWKVLVIVILMMDANMEPAIVASR